MMSSRLLPLVLVAFVACRGDKSEDPPVHLIRNMLNQPRFDPSSESSMFPDHRTMRPLPAGVVSQTSLKADDFCGIIAAYRE